ncbi:hypothetical protein GCM10023196_033400 [Actinoallomurus vinaceus]|uniref:Uncharacterized protein n=1 Tax=Actinoallomurus vinaceus TaxID=1080074 RepID=A0ABP8U865_9ACTN
MRPRIPVRSADGDGDRILRELAMDLLVKAAIVVVALIVLAVVLTIIYRKVGTRR